MEQLKLYKGSAVEYDAKKNKIADGGLVMVKDNDSSETGSLYINDNGTHVQVSTNQAFVEATYADGKLQTKRLNGDVDDVLNVDNSLDINSVNPIQNKTVTEALESMSDIIEDNVVTLGKHDQALTDLENSIDELEGRTINGQPLSGNVELSATDVGAATAADVELAISEHNVNVDAHGDIRLTIEQISERLNALANSTDVDLDQMAELVDYIKNNRELIEGVTTDKVNVSDIIDNLTTNVSDVPLSAAQGVALAQLIEELRVEVENGTNIDNIENIAYIDVEDNVNIEYNEPVANNFAWTLVGTKNGTTALNLPSSFNELLVVMKFIGDTKYTCLIPAVDLTTSMQLYTVGHAFTTESRGAIEFNVSLSKAQIQEAYLNSERVVSTTSMTIYYR